MPRQIIHEEPAVMPESEIRLPQGAEPAWRLAVDAPASIGRLAMNDGSRWDRGIEGTTSITGPKGFELTMTDELHDAIGGHFGQVRKEFGTLIDKIMADPFGDTNIDAFKDTEAGQWSRLVHRVDGPLANLIPGKKLAIKATGLDMDRTRDYLEIGGPSRTGLSRQFRETLALSQKQQELAPNGINDSVSVNVVYGVLKYANPDGSKQEWLLMEHIDNGKPVENKEQVLSRGSIALAFNKKTEPVLADIADPYHMQYSDYIHFDDLAEELSMSLGYGRIIPAALKDLNGNNILRQDTPMGPRYTLIDIASA